jgi:acyl-coenzyme A thioesterase PaaI-like protein
MDPLATPPLNDAEPPEPGGFPAMRRWEELTTPAPGPAGGADDYAVMIEALRVFLDRVAAAKPDPETARRVTTQLDGLSAVLEPLAVPEREQVFAHRTDLPGRGQTMSPRFEVVEGDAEHVVAHVVFGRYFLGGNGAAHGGSIPLLFDEVLGRLANMGGRPRARTAYLNVNFRSITPIGVPLDVAAHVVKEDGRKRFLVGTLHHGDTLCADAEGLFVELCPGQP